MSNNSNNYNNTPLAAIMTENYSTLKNSLADFTFAYDDVRSFLFAVFLYLFTVISTRSLFFLLHC